MLHEILKAHGGKLPDDVIVAFANTGKEREETLRFVHNCAYYWDVRIRWVEWRDTPERFEEVRHNSASRYGEPFAALIAKKKYLPNAVARFCTQELKVKTLEALMRSLGFETWANVIGLRYDEGTRVLKALARNDMGKSPWTTVMPMSKAKATRADVMAFWEKQPFDLALRGYEGNCDLCMLKSRAALQTLMREQRGCADWWIKQERATGGRFVTEYSYESLLRNESAQLHFFDGEYDAECGLMCGAE